MTHGVHMPNRDNHDMFFDLFHIPKIVQELIDHNFEEFGCS